MPVKNLLYTFLTSANRSPYDSSKIISQYYLNKFFFNKRIRYKVELEPSGSMVSPFTISRGLPSIVDNIIGFEDTNNKIATTNYQNSTINVKNFCIGSSNETSNVDSIDTVILNNKPIIHLNNTFNAKNLDMALDSSTTSGVIINFKGVPTDNFTKKVIQKKDISNGARVTINAISTGHVITNTGIKNLADRFDAIDFSIRNKSHSAIIGGVYSAVGEPTNKSRIYNVNGTIFTDVLDLSNHDSTSLYGFSFTSNKLEHSNSDASWLEKGSSSAFATNNNSSNNGIIVWFSKNQTTANGIIGLIPAGSNIVMKETGISSKNITITVALEFFNKGKVNAEYFNANKSHLYIINAQGKKELSGNTYDSGAIYYSQEQLFTIVAPAFKETES